MKPIKFLQKNSIATQLIKIVFGFYCIVALTITIIQISIEYQHTRQSVENELAINQQIFEPVLSAGIWNLDDEQVMNTLNGMMAIPIIIGVKIEKKEQNYKAIGIVKTKSGQQKKYDAHGMGLFILENEYKDVFSYQFPIHYVFRGEPRKVGTATLYSNSSVIIDRVKIGIILLIINAVIKTIALWLLFFWVGKRILLTPLNKLVQAIENVNFDDLDELKIDLKNKRENELTIIENAFSDMLKNLADARIELIKSRLILEEKVKLRTHDLQRAKLEAERANEVKTEFMSQISHELNTPLNAILAGSQVLKTCIGPSQSQNLLLANQIYSAGVHLSMLVNDVIDVVNTSKDELEVVIDNCQLNDIIKSSIAMIKPITEERNITIDYEENNLVILADMGRVRQVLINLLTNAVKYNKDNGFIEISALKNSVGSVELSVKDSGVGISIEDDKCIFEPFVRLDYAKKNCITGMGIGLPLVKMLVEHMTASIHFESTVGFGSTFTITFKGASECKKHNK